MLQGYGATVALSFIFHFYRMHERISAIHAKDKTFQLIIFETHSILNCRNQINHTYFWPFPQNIIDHNLTFLNWYCVQKIKLFH